MSNTLESSDPQYHKSSKNESNMIQDTETITFPEIRSRSNHDACLIPNVQSGIELDTCQNILPFCEKQPSGTDHSHTLPIQASDSFLSVNRQLVRESQKFLHNRCDTVKEIHVQTKLSELSVSQDSCPSPQQSPECDTNRVHVLDSLTHQHSRNEQITSQGSYPVSYQPHQSTSNVSQAVCSVSREGFGNEFSPSRITNIGGYCQYSGGTQGLPLQSFQQSGGIAKYIQNSSPKGFQQSKSATNYLEHSLPEGFQQSVSDPNTIKISSTIVTSIDELIKDSIDNQNLCSLTQQPVGSRTRGNQAFPQVPQTFKLNSPTERRLSYSPYSRTQQQPKKCLREVQQAESISSFIPPPNPLLNGFLEMCLVVDQNRSSEKAQDRMFWPEHYDLRILQCSCAIRYEFMSIIVHGPVKCTSELVQAFSRWLPSKLDSPFGPLFQGIVTRGKIASLISVSQIADLYNCGLFLKTTCTSVKTTIILMFNGIEKRLRSLIELIRREVGLNTRILIVVNTKGRRKRKLPSLANIGFKLKARYDLSAFLLYHVDFSDEVEAVFFTAIDLSRLITI